MKLLFKVGSGHQEGADEWARELNFENLSQEMAQGQASTSFLWRR